MKRLFCSLQVTVLFFLFASVHSFASVIDSTGVKTVEGKKYIVHQVAAKETWFSIAKRYSITVDELQKANVGTAKLKTGKEILVPMKEAAEVKEELKKYVREAIIYDVKKKETLYSLAKTYNTVPDSIKLWNHITGRKVKAGEKIIVGYKTIIIETPKPPDTAMAVSKPSVDKLRKASSKADSLIKKNNAPAKPRHAVQENGVASWIADDGMPATLYFALHRTAPMGTIIKVTNKMNKKYVFVKVLGVLPDTGDNHDLIIKISKSSAEKLGVRDLHFQCQLDYSVTD